MFGPERLPSLVGTDSLGSNTFAAGRSRTAPEIGSGPGAMFWLTIVSGPRWGMTNPAHIPSFHYILHPCLTPLCRADIHQDGRPNSTPDGSRDSRPYGIPGPDHCQRKGASAAPACSDPCPDALRSPEGAAEAYRTILSAITILALQFYAGCSTSQPISGSSSFHLVVL
jgi:hypothetical protein